MLSIQEKVEDLSLYSPKEHYFQWAHHADRVIKALSAYILKDGLLEESDHE